MTTDIDLGAHTSPAALVQALDRARQAIRQGAAGDPQALLAALPQLWRYSLLRGALAPADGRAMSATQQERREAAIACDLVKMLAQGRRYREALALPIAAGPARAWATRAIAAAMAEHGDSDQALALADSIRNERQRLGAHIAIARTLSKAQRWDQSIALARTAGHYLDDIACDMASAGLCDEALALLRTSGDGGPHNGAMGEIAASLAQSGRYEEALAIASTIRHRRRKATAHDAIAGAMAQAGQYDQALALMRTTKVSGFVPRALIAALGRAGRWGEAESLAHAVKSRAPQPRQRRAHAEAAQLALIRALCQDQRWEDALRLIPPPQQSWQRSFALAVVALALAQAGHHDQALALAQGDARATADVHAEICAQLAAARQWDAAAAIARAADGASNPLVARALLAAALAEAGEWPRLIALVAETWAASADARHTRRELLLAAPLIARYPDLAMALVRG